jgi:hypothetical protein
MMDKNDMHEKQMGVIKFDLYTGNLILQGRIGIESSTRHAIRKHSKFKSHEMTLTVLITIKIKSHEMTLQKTTENSSFKRFQCAFEDNVYSAPFPISTKT